MKHILMRSCSHVLGLKSLKMVALLLALLSTAACSATYDCADTEVTEALIEEVAIHAQKPEWMDAIRRNTTVGGVTTLDVDEELDHYLCSTKLTFTDKERSVESVDITYGVKPVEGGDREFELLWETVDSILGEIDPIKNMTGKIVDPWYRAEKNEQQRKTLEQVAEIEKIATQRAIEHARANPPIPYKREELLHFAATSPEVARIDPTFQYEKRVAEAIGDLNGDGHDDFAEIRVLDDTHTVWTYVQFPTNYAQKFDVSISDAGGFDGYGAAEPFTRMQILEGKVVISFPDGTTRSYDAAKVGEPLPEFDKSRQSEIRDALMKERGVEWNGVVQTY